MKEKNINIETVPQESDNDSLSDVEAIVRRETSGRIDFTYLMQPPKAYTFEQPALYKWTQRWLRGKVLNLFAGKTKIYTDEFRVDIDPAVKPDYLGDAYDFVSTTEMKFDVVIFDPPYNLRKAREKYDGRYIGSLTRVKNILPQIVKPEGLVITYGYDSVGMSRRRGFEKIAICLVCHSGDHNDTICLVERKVDSLFSA